MKPFSALKAIPILLLQLKGKEDIRLLLSLTIVLSLLLSPTWSSAALIDATSSVTARCHTGIRDTATGVPEEAYASCDGVSPGQNSSAIVATGFGGVFPQVGNVVASASLVRGEVVGAQSEAFASGLVTYYFAIEQVGAPPSVPISIPFRFHASGEVSVTGDSTVPSTAEAFIPNIDGAYIGVDLTGPGNIEFNESILLWADPGIAYPVLVGASCDLRLGSPGTAASCSAMVDPFFTFDQQVFNETQQDPFLLESFFDITYSANVQFDQPLQSVSEPSSLSLLSGAVVLLHLMRARRRRERRL